MSGLDNMKPAVVEIPTGWQQQNVQSGRGIGLVVSVIAFNSYNQSSNPADVYNFDSIKMFEMNESKATKVRRLAP